MGARAETAVLIAAIVVLSSTHARPEGHGSGQNTVEAKVAPINVAYQNDTAAAFNADRSGNYAEALRLFLKLDAEGQAGSSPANLAGARERIGEYYEKGVGGVTQNYGVAASWYEKAISGGPSARASIRLGFLYANGLGRQQDRAKAIELFKSIGPSSQIYITLLDHNMLPKSDDDMKRSDFERAKKAREGEAQQEGVPQQLAANNGSALVPQDPSPEQRQCSSDNRSSPDLLITSCTALIQSSSQTPDTLATAYMIRGWALMEKGQVERGFADFNKAIGTDPQARFYFLRGNAYHVHGQDNLAIADYNQAIRINPNDADYFQWRGKAYNAMHQYDRAIADFTRAIEIKPDYAEAYCERGASYHQKGQLDRAISDLDQALRIKPNFADALYLRGIGYTEKDNYERAVADFDQAIRLDPNNAEAIKWRDRAKDALAQPKRNTEANQDVVRQFASPNSAMLALDCKYKGDGSRGSVLLDLSRRLLVRAELEHVRANIPLTVTDSEYKWNTSDGYTYIVERNTQQVHVIIPGLQGMYFVWYCSKKDRI